MVSSSFIARRDPVALAAAVEAFVADCVVATLERQLDGRHIVRAAQRLAGLTLGVLDQHTGEQRSTTSLSGGETFYTSLALALGLADVVRGMAMINRAR